MRKKRDEKEQYMSEVEMVRRLQQEMEEERRMQIEKRR
jgi:hypothetical protein